MAGTKAVGFSLLHGVLGFWGVKPGDFNECCMAKWVKPQVFSMVFEGV